MVQHLLQYARMNTERGLYLENGTIQYTRVCKQTEQADKNDSLTGEQAGKKANREREGNV